MRGGHVVLTRIESVVLSRLITFTDVLTAAPIPSFYGCIVPVYIQ